MALAFLLGRRAAADGPHDSGEDGRVTYAPASERQELLKRKVGQGSASFGGQGTHTCMSPFQERHDWSHFSESEGHVLV